MRGIYKNKHDFLVGELKKKNWVQNIAGDNAGLHVLVQVNTTLTEEEICKKAAECGIRLMGIREHYIHTPPEGRPVLLLGYGNRTNRKYKKGWKCLKAL